MSDADALVSALEAQILSQRREIDAHHTALQHVHRMHQADIERIGYELIMTLGADEDREAYDDFADRLNPLLHKSLPVRERMFTIHRTYSVQIRTTISAQSAEDAMDAAGRVEFDVTGRYGWDLIESDLIEQQAEEPS